MVSSKATTVKDYLAALPPERAKSLETVRKVIRKALPHGFEEGMCFGMLCYYVPLSRYPDTYNGQPLGVAALAAQKDYFSLYLMGVYANSKTKSWFETRWAKSGKKLNMGKSCVRFKAVEELPLDVIADVIAKVTLEDFLASYEASRGVSKKRPIKKATAPKSAKKNRKRLAAKQKA